MLAALMVRVASTFVLVAMLAAPLRAEAFGANPVGSNAVGGQEGEIDISAHFIGDFGEVEPTERPTTWHDADIKIFTASAGYTIGEVGPLSDLYLRVDGGFYIAGEERIESADDDLPVGYQFYDEDKGGFVTATMAANFIDEARYSFGAFVQGTVPIDVELAKFSTVHLHYVAGGLTVGAFLTDPTKLVRLAYAGRVFVGSGAYDGGFQHNASIALTQLFAIELARWLLPWRVGVHFGPHFEGDLNEHVDRSYFDAYARVAPDFVNGDRVRAMRLSIAVLPFIRITDHAALELGFVQQLFGYDAPATQRFTAGVRVSF